MVQSTYEDEDGLLWIASSEGLLRYDPRIPIDTKQRLPVLIRRVMAGGGKVLYGGGVPQDDNKPHFEIPYGQNALRFEYALPAYDHWEANRYQVFMEGKDGGKDGSQDGDWSDWTAEAYKDYTHLSEGAYRFRVRGRNAYGEISPEGVYGFKILPPWYRTWWAYVGYILGSISGVWGLVRWRMRALERERDFLEKKVQERTAELQKVNVIIKSINEKLELDELLSAILEEACAVPGIQKSTALVWDSHRQAFRVRATRGWDLRVFEGLEFGSAELHDRYIKGAQEVAPDLFLIRDVEGRSGEEKLQAVGLPQMMLVMRLSVAVKSEKGEQSLSLNPEGYFVFENMEDRNAFSARDIELLEGLKEHFVSAFLKARAMLQLEAALEDTRKTKDLVELAPTPLDTEEVNKAERFVDPRRAIDSAVPDAYENNDYQYTAKVLTVGSIQPHNFYDDATDWVYFNVEKGNEYVVETSVLEKCDTQISLYEGSTLVGTSDDKSKEDYGSKIQFKATANAKLNLKVSSYGYRTGAGRPYALSLKKVGSEITPDDENTDGANNELPLAKKKWTFMVYLDGDNNLDSFGAKDIEEMAAAIKTEDDSKDLNVVVLWDTEGTKHGYYAIEEGKAVLKNDIGEPNMGNAKTAKDFIDWTTTNYPSDRHAFVFWNHGGAVDRGVCWDDSNGGDYLTEVEQLDIMNYGRTRIGKKFDLVGYDACLMACGELFYQLRNTADYMVASEQLEPGNGWDYNFLKTLISNPNSTGEALGRAILSSYASFYSTSRDVTFSLADLSMAGDFGTAVDAFAREAMQARDGAVYGRLAKDLPLFGDYYTKDLVAYMNMVIKSTDPVVTSAVKARARDVVSAVNAMILREWHSAMWNNKAFGVAMTMKADTAVYSQHLICQATKWNEFCDFAEFPNY